MARSPLFALFTRAFALHRRARAGVPFDELVDLDRAARARRGMDRAARARRAVDRDRRRILLGAAGATLALPLMGPGCDASAGIVPIAIVGGGIAGIHAAYRLRQRGIVASIYEATQRLGGRIYTDRSTFFSQPGQLGQHAELGGELISSDHHTMQDLAAELSLPLLDYDTDDAQPATYFFGGRLVPESELYAGFAPIAAAIEGALGHANAPGLAPTYTDDNGLATYDQLSISAWLDSIGASGPIRALLEVAYTIEYGLDVGEQSALNLIMLISTSATKLALFGGADERYHVGVGNDSILAGLAAALDPTQVILSYQLVRVAARSDGRYTLSFQTADGSREVVAVRVLLTLPFSVLRGVELVGIDLPAQKQQAINELGYGSNTKLMLGFSSRPWRAGLGANGTSYSDLGYQASWETSRLQPGDGGILTNYTGGAHGLDAANGTPHDQRDAFLVQIDQVFPGTAGASTGAVATYPWQTYAFSQGSYSVYKVGQWTAFRGAEIERVGNLLFAGEHTSLEAQGFMEGAALTGAIAAETIAGDLGEGMTAAPLSPAAARIVARARY